MKKALDIVRTILVWLVVLVAVTMTVFTFFSLTTLNRNDRSFLGYRIFIVNTDSMEKTDFKSGDLIFVKEIDPEKLQIGDIITFISKDENSLDETLTHKIRSFVTDSSGSRGFITYGTSTNADDQGVVLYQDVLGKYEFHIAGLGTVFAFLKTTPGFFLCIFTPIMLVIIYEIINFFVLLKKSKKEEMEYAEAERLAKEKLMAELLLLKSQLEEKNSDPAVVPASAPAICAPTRATVVNKSVKVKVVSHREAYLVSRVVVKKKIVKKGNNFGKTN